MATTKNKNLFYQLYSRSNDVTNSGYACSSSIDENDTSFDISNNEAQITDSNGDVLASLDLSEIHADGLTQYTSETKILAPHSAAILQGNEYGETYKSQFFLINKIFYNIEGFENYCNLKFDILYKQKGKLNNIHVDTKCIRKTYGSFVELAQIQLNQLKLPITISVKVYDDTDSSNSVLQYINFQSTLQGYDFLIRNVMLTPILKGDQTINGLIGEFVDSPFQEPILSQELILQFLNNYTPQKIDNSTTIQTQEYYIECGVYREFIKISNNITDDINTFFYELKILITKFLPLFDKAGKLLDETAFNELIQKYPQIYLKYFNDVFKKFNIYDIVNILIAIKNYILKVRSENGVSYCLEDLNRRINHVKYPNGAMRGIVIIPNWPQTDETEHSVLWVNHVADKVEICVPVDIESLQKYYGGNIISNKKARLFEKAIANVQINALISQERDEYFIDESDNLPLNDISSTQGFTKSFDYLQIPAYDTADFIDNDFHRLPLYQDAIEDIENSDIWNNPDYQIGYIKNNDDENIWETNPNGHGVRFVDTHEDLSNKVIGLYKYMEYLSNNDLWLRVGDVYMISGKDDDMQTNNKNLLQSVLIYNPNDIPIRIKYMIFS